MKRLDCLGDICPVPVIKLQRELQRLEGQESIQIVTDHSCTLGAIKEFCKAHKLKLDAEEAIAGV